MKTQIKKIMISVAALLFLGSSVSFAHDWNGRNHKQHGKAGRHYMVKKQHPGWSNNHLKTWRHFRKSNWKHIRKMNQKNLRRLQLSGYYCEDGYFHYFDKRDRRWKDDHYKQRRHHRSDRREDIVYKRAYKDSGMVFKVIVK